MLNSSQEQIVTKSLMQFRNRVVLLLNFLKFFHQFAALKFVYFMEICIFNQSLLSPAPIHCKILCSVRENGIVVALHTYFRLNSVLAGARLLFRLKNSRHQKEEKEAFDTEHRKIAIGLKQSRATDEMIVQVWQRVQHERFVPCCTPSFSCRLEKHPPATNPAQVETRSRQTWQSQFLLGPTIYSRPPMARIVWFPFDQQADQSAISPLSDVPLGPSSGIRRWWTFIWISTRSEQLNCLGQNPLIYSNYYWITRPSVNVEQKLCWTSSVSTAKLLLIKK